MEDGCFNPQSIRRIPPVTRLFRICRLSFSALGLLASAWLLSGCGDDPAPFEPAPDDPWVPEMVEASLDAVPRMGPPGYETTITASCIARGTTAGIQQFFVRGSDNQVLNYSVTNPESDSMVIALKVPVNQRTVVSMRCAGVAGEAIEDELVLDGYPPEINLDDFPAVVLREDTPQDIHLSPDLFRYVDQVDVTSLLGILSVQLSGWPEAPVLRMAPHSGRSGDLNIRLWASNSFGGREFTVPARITPVTDLVYDLRIAGSLSPASTTIAWYDGSGFLLGSAAHPPYMISRQLDDAMTGEVVVEAGTDRDVFFSYRRTFDTASGKDILLLATLHQTQYCRQIFASGPDPLSACRDMAAETLFTFDETPGYRPYPVLPSVFILTRNPETGRAMPDDWVAAFERIAPELEQLGVSIIRKDALEPRDTYDRAANGALVFDVGSWIYPRTDVEAINTNFRTLHPVDPTAEPWKPDASGLLKSISRAMDVDVSPSPDQELITWVLEAAYGIRTGEAWFSLPGSMRRAFLVDVVSRFRFDDRTEWAIAAGEDIDRVMRLPE